MGRLHLTSASLFWVLWRVATHIFPGKRALVFYLPPDVAVLIGGFGLSGSEKTFRFVVSHDSGKIEILGMADAQTLVMKYHQCRDPSQIGRVFTRPFREDECWVEDIEPA